MIKWIASMNKQIEKKKKKFWLLCWPSIPVIVYQQKEEILEIYKSHYRKVEFVADLFVQYQTLHCARKLGGTIGSIPSGSD